MEIRRWQIYIVINCFIVTHLEAKTVSLNELIAAESKQTQEKTPRTKSTDLGAKTVSLNELIAAEPKQKQNKTPRTKSTKSTAKSPRRQSFSLKDLFAAEAKETRRRLESLLSRTSGSGLLSHRKRLLPSLSLKNFESSDSLFSRAKTLAPLNFRKIFEIKSPLKPQRLKYSLSPRYYRKKQSKKREIYENEKINHKYIPLIKRLGLLVDDILSSGSGESYEVSINRHKPRRNKSKLSDDRKEPKCKCDVKSDLESAESKPHKKAVIVSTTVSPEITTDAQDTTTEASTTAADNTPASDVYTVRPDPNLSLLFTRNSTSPRRDYYGFSERSSSTLHRDIERNIPGNNGNDQYNSRGQRNQTCASDFEENSCGSPRNDASSDRSIDRLYGDRIYARDSNDRYETQKTNKISSDVDGLVRRNDDEYEEKSKFQVGRKKEETIQLPGDVRRLQQFLPEHKIIIDTKSLQPQETGEKIIFNVTYTSTSPERVTQRNGAVATENQTLRPPVETVKPINGLLNPTFPKPNSQLNQVVTIFDGYSVARDINGRNKLSEKSIHISS